MTEVLLHTTSFFMILVTIVEIIELLMLPVLNAWILIKFWKSPRHLKSLWSIDDKIRRLNVCFACNASSRIKLNSSNKLQKSSSKTQIGNVGLKYLENFQMNLWSWGYSRSISL